MRRYALSLLVIAEGLLTTGQTLAQGTADTVTLSQFVSRLSQQARQTEEELWPAGAVNLSHIPGGSLWKPPSEDTPGYRLVDLDLPSPAERRVAHDKKRSEELRKTLEIVDGFTTEELLDRDKNPQGYTREQLASYWRAKYSRRYTDEQPTDKQIREGLKGADFFRFISEIKSGKTLGDLLVRRGPTARMDLSGAKVDDAQIDERSVRIERYFREASSLLENELVGSNIVRAVVVAEVEDVRMLDRYDYGTEVTLAVERYIKPPSDQPESQTVRVRMVTNSLWGDPSNPGRVGLPHDQPPRIGDRGLFLLTTIPFDFRRSVQTGLDAHDLMWGQYRTEITGAEGFYEFFRQRVVGATLAQRGAQYSEHDLEEDVSRIETALEAKGGAQ